MEGGKEGLIQWEDEFLKARAGFGGNVCTPVGDGESERAEVEATLCHQMVCVVAMM